MSTPAPDSTFTPATGLLAGLDLLQISQDGAVLHIRLNRPVKRNAINDGLIAQLHTAFVNLPADVRAVVVSGEGAHFCAGLDLSELVERDIQAAILHSRGWHAAFDAIQFGRVPVIAVLHGAVVGGGLELAASCHIRVAEDSAYFGLPEGQRGIFVGGGGSVRVPRLIGASRMADMMFTGRVYNAEDGERIGLAHYLVPEGKGLEKGIELAKKIAGNAPHTNYGLMHVLPRIAEATHDHGMMMESMIAGIVQAEPAAKARLTAFLEKRAAKVQKS